MADKGALLTWVVQQVADISAFGPVCGTGMQKILVYDAFSGGCGCIDS
jgi:hypothetical protein